MSKSENRYKIKDVETVSERGLELPHLSTTERGLALARKTLAEAFAKALEAESAHRINLEKARLEDKAVIKDLRVQMYGQAGEQAISEVEGWESDIWAEAEKTLEVETGLEPENTISAATDE